MAGAIAGAAGGTIARSIQVTEPTHFHIADNAAAVVVFVGFFCVVVAVELVVVIIAIFVVVWQFDHIWYSQIIQIKVIQVSEKSCVRKMAP